MQRIRIWSMEGSTQHKLGTHLSTHFSKSSPSSVLLPSLALVEEITQAIADAEIYQIKPMSLASSFPSIKLKLKLSPPSHPCKSTYRQLTVVRNSKADGPLRRPSLSPPPSLSTPPSLSPPPSPTAPVKPMAPADPSPLTQAPANVAVAEVDFKGAVTFEYQRKVAKELQDYFKQKKLEAADQGPFFGFIGKNEIANGRWAMFGFAVGMLTEYATGSDFVQQLKILLSNFGIVDLD